MKILAILQNQWFKKPERMKQLLAKHYSGTEEGQRGREDFNRTFLFFGCLTGKRLTAAFGEDVCDRIIWGEASPQIGGFSSAAFPPDTKHIIDLLIKYEPEIVVTFGKIAATGLSEAMGLIECPPKTFELIAAPHPAARHATVMNELRAAAAWVAEFEAAGVGGSK